MLSADTKDPEAAVNAQTMIYIFGTQASGSSVKLIASEMFSADTKDPEAAVPQLMKVSSEGYAITTKITVIILFK